MFNRSFGHAHENGMYYIAIVIACLSPMKKYREVDIYSEKQLTQYRSTKQNEKQASWRLSKTMSFGASCHFSAVRFQ